MIRTRPPARATQLAAARNRRSARLRARYRVTLCNSRWSAPSAQVTADRRASPGRLADRPCSTEQALCGLRAKVIEDYPHMMPAYDPNVCDDACRLFLSCREAAGEKAELKGLIAGCGGQAFEHLPAACPPDPAPWCGSPAITGQARRSVAAPAPAVSDGGRV